MIFDIGELLLSLIAQNNFRNAIEINQNQQLQAGGEKLLITTIVPQFFFIMLSKFFGVNVTLRSIIQNRRRQGRGQQETGKATRIMMTETDNNNNNFDSGGGCNGEMKRNANDNEKVKKKDAIMYQAIFFVLCYICLGNNIMSLLFSYPSTNSIMRVRSQELGLNVLMIMIFYFIFFFQIINVFCSFPCAFK